MKLERLRIRRLPGIEQPYGVEDLNPGLNFIGGPNGSGKSSIARAVRAVLWPKFRESAASEVTAEFEKNGDRWHATLAGKECVWTKNGRPHAAPLVPPAEHARCFTIGAEDLRDLSGDDGELASLILRQLSGGYDIEALLDAPPLSLGARHGHHERRLLHRELKQLEQAKNRHRSLETRERNLAELRRNLGLARAARQELDLLQTARQLEIAREDERRIIGELNSLPKAASRLVGDELEKLDALNQELALLEAEIKSLRSHEAQTLERRAACALGDSGLNDARIRGLRSRVETLRDLERAAQESQRECQTAASRVKFGEAHIDLDPLEDLPVISMDLLDEVEDLVRAADELSHRQAAIVAEIELIPPISDGFDRHDADRSIRLLRTWLRAPDQAGSTRAVIFGAIVATIAVGILLSVAPQAIWVAPLCFLPIGPSAMSWWRERRVLGRDRIAADFRREGHVEPTTWTSIDVVQHMEELEAELVGHGQQERRDRLRTKLQSIEDHGAKLQERRRVVHEAIGLDPLGSDLGTWTIGHELIVQSDARRAWHLQSEKLAQRRTQRDEYAARLSKDVAGYVALSSTVEVDELSHAIEELADRAARHLEFGRELESLAERATRAETERARVEVKLGRLFSEAGLQIDDRHELSRQIDAVPEHRRLDSERHKIEWRIDHLRRELGGRSELTGSKLDAAIARCEEITQRHEELVASVNEIEREVSAARAGNTLEEALASVHNARSRLRRERQRAIESRAGQLLIDQVIEEHRERSQPRLLERAIDLFAAFTQDRFRLTVSPNHGGVGERATFHAIDVSTRDVLPPSALSSGTRTQLLLAVRLAFALENERGTTLPFFLDEVLSHSDPQRCRAVAESLRHMVESESRQVFYLSCQPEEQSLFCEAFDSGASIRVFDLAQSRAERQSDPNPTAPEVREATLPDPGLSPQQFARDADVARFDLSRGIEAQHVFHILAPDLVLVHRLLVLGIETIGQLTSFLQSARSKAFLDESQVQSAGAACLIAHEFATSWSVGRGRPIDRTVLNEGGVRGKYLSSLSELTDELGGDAQRLLRSLDTRDDERTKGFRQQRELTEFLEEHGYLDRRSIRAPEEIHVETLSRLATLVESGGMASGELSDRIRHLITLGSRRDPSRSKPRRTATRRPDRSRR